jgi:chemotaxis protein CheD
MVSDMKLGRKGDTLVTHALGSCLGLMVWDPAIAVGGLLHAMLPLSNINPQKAEANPYMFVDTGVPAMFQRLYDLGAQKGRLIIKAAGCASPLGKNEMFKIGQRNYTLLKKLLWKNSLMLAVEDVGGTKSRTVFFDVGSGRITINSSGQETEL